MHIVLTSNSPGEVAGWVRPVVTKLAEQWPEAKVHLFLLPCSFASGSECAVASDLPGIEAVYSSQDYWRLALLGRLPEGYQPAENGLVLFLGGDQTHAVLLGRRLGYPVHIYTEGRALWPKRVQQYYVPYRSALEKVEAVAPGKGMVVGNLMLDAVTPTVSREKFRAELGISPSDLLVALFPGSRLNEFQYIVPFFLETVRLLQEKKPQIRFVVSLSPFVPPEIATNLLSIELPGIVVLRNAQYNIMQAADLGLTIPGTNTAEMAFLGLPMLVAVPLDRPDLIPLEGLPGLVGKMPVVGKWIKTKAISKLNQRLRFTALPNIIGDREIAPELRGLIKPQDVAERAAHLLSDPEERARLSQELRQIMGKAGAAQRLVLALQTSTRQN